MNTREKKFFVPEIKTYDYDLSQRWRVEWYEPYKNGLISKRIVKYGNINQGTTVQQRMRYADELLKSLNLSSPVKIQKNILEEAIEINTVNWRPKTVSAYKTVSDAYKEYLKSRYPEKSTTYDIQSFLLHLHQGKGKKKVNSNTITKYRNTLYTLYEKAILAGLIEHNPVQKVTGFQRDPKSLQFFSDSQIEKFKQIEVNPQLWLAIQFLFYCFIRPGEMRLLKISAINLEYNFIEIPGEISKNKKTQKVTIPKQFKRNIEFLENYPNNYYILSKNGKPGQVPISTKWLNDEHRKVLDKLNIIGRYAFYSWKHTGVVKAVKAGINIKDLQLQLRHHSLDMVNEYLKNLGVLDSPELLNKYPTL